MKIEVVFHRRGAEFSQRNAEKYFAKLGVLIWRVSAVKIYNTN